MHAQGLLIECKGINLKVFNLKRSAFWLNEGGLEIKYPECLSFKSTSRIFF